MQGLVYAWLAPLSRRAINARWARTENPSTGPHQIGDPRNRNRGAKERANERKSERHKGLLKKVNGMHRRVSSLSFSNN